MKRKVITMGILHSNKFEYLKYKPQKYSGDIVKDINKTKIYESALDESIDLTFNYFQEALQFLAKPIPFCKYCDVKNRKDGIEWKTSTKRIEGYL